MEQFQTSHSQIRNIVMGNPYDVDSLQKIDGVQMLWNIDTISATGDNACSYSLVAFMMSQVTVVNDPTNEYWVQSEAILQCSDLLNYLSNYNYSQFTGDKNVNVDLQKTWTISPFKERFNSLYSGAFMQFQIVSNYSYNRCIIPIE